MLVFLGLIVTAFHQKLKDEDSSTMLFMGFFTFAFNTFTCVICKGPEVTAYYILLIYQNNTYFVLIVYSAVINSRAYSIYYKIKK